MSRWLTQLSKKKNQKTKQLWEKEFSIVEEGLNEEQVVAFVDDLIAHRDASQKSPSDSVRSIIERAVTDAEQIANSLKMKAQKEAAEEAIRIIDKAKQEAEEIRRQVETVTQKETGDILSVLNEKTRLIEEEAKQKVELLLLQTRQEIEKEVREEYKEAHSRLLHSLMKGAEEVLPFAETPAPSQIEQKPVVVSKEPEAKPSAKEEAKQKAEEAKKADDARKRAEKEAKLAAKDETKKKVEEAKQAEEARKQAEKEAKLTAKKETKKKTEDAKKAEETQPPVEPKTEPAAAESAIEKKVKKPIQVEEEAIVSKTVESIPKEAPKQHVPEKKIDRQEAVGVPQELNTEASYDGEIELVIAVPVDPAAVSKLYNYLQSTPDMKILYTRGSWDRGTTITVALDKPLPLIGMISRISGLKIAPGSPQKDSPVKGSSGSLLGAKRKEATRIDLVLKTE